MRISVCIATFNGELYIYEQLVSILNQKLAVYEVIICDDISTDNTLLEISRIKDPRLKVFVNPYRLGVGKNFERAISFCSGDYIFLSDQDDIWTPDKTLVFSRYFQNRSVIISDAFVVDENLNIISNSFFEIRNTSKVYWVNLLRFGFLGCCFAVPREVVMKCIPFPRNQRLCTHDNWIYLAAGLITDFDVINDKLMYYRRHGKNVSLGGLENRSSIFFMVRYRLYVYQKLLKFYINELIIHIR